MHDIFFHAEVVCYVDRIFIHLFLLKAEPSKKRAAESATKTPVQDKKAKVTPQKTGDYLDCMLLTVSCSSLFPGVLYV